MNVWYSHICAFFINTLNNKISSQFNNCLSCKIRVSVMISTYNSCQVIRKKKKTL